MEIRAARVLELEEIMQIYSSAREFMRAQGNPDQWWSGYPQKELIKSDIERGRCHVVIDGESILAVFYAALENDPTYLKIYGGEWGSELPYGVIHRVAVSPSARGRGVAGFIFSHMEEKFGRIRIDTHENNIPMQRALTKAGFVRRGFIYIKSPEGLTPEEQRIYRRIAYDKG